jgi:hypothetical protein
MLIARRAMAGICRFVHLLLRWRFCFSVRHERASRNDGAQVYDFLTTQRTTGRRQRADRGSEGLTDRRADVPLGAAFAGPRPTRSDRFECDRSGYDGSRYWWGGDCWPTEPGGCDC